MPVKLNLPSRRADTVVDEHERDILLLAVPLYRVLPVLGYRA